MADWLPVEHPVWFVIEVVKDLAPGLKGFHARPVLGGTGRARYDPTMLVTLLVYAMWQGVRSSRQIEARCHTDVAFRIVCAQDPPDHSTIARFRQVNPTRFADLLTQSLPLAPGQGWAGSARSPSTGCRTRPYLHVSGSRGRGLRRPRPDPLVSIRGVHLRRGEHGWQLGCRVAIKLAGWKTLSAGNFVL